MKVTSRLMLIASVSALTALPAVSAQAQNTSTSSSTSSSYSSSSSSGPGGSSYSSSSNSIALKNSPLLDALVSVSRTTRTPVFVTTEAAEVLKTTSHKVTLSERNLSPEQLFAKLLEGSQLAAHPIGSNVCVLTETESIAEVQAAVDESIKAKTETVKGLIPLSWIHLDKALDSPVTLVMIQTPVPFVIQMLEGMAGVRIGIPAEFQDPFFVSQPLVTVQAQDDPLRDVLQSVAKQIRCELDVSDGIIALRRGKPSESR